MTTTNYSLATIEVQSCDRINLIQRKIILKKVALLYVYT